VTQIYSALEIFHDKERRAVDALIEIYGDDTDVVLNALHAIAARLAVATGVDPQDFANGIKHHWDFVADAINDVDAPRRQGSGA
jgi:hypothetical protein